jgi:transposase
MRNLAPDGFERRLGYKLTPEVATPTPLILKPLARKTMNPSNALQCVIGIDVAKHELVVARLGSTAVVTIANDKRSIRAWLASVPKAALLGVESTGGYHEELAQAAHARGVKVYVLNPRAVRDYARGIGRRGKTDRIDAQVIARYIDREHGELHPWIPPTPAQAELGSLLKRRAKLIVAKGMIRQSLARLPRMARETAVALCHIDRLVARIDLQLEHTVRQLTAGDLTTLRSIPGIGLLSGAALLNVFNRYGFRGAEAAVAYSGLDPRPQDSGQKRGRRRLSKRGPAELRRLLYNAAMSAAKTKTWKPFYERQRAKGLSTTAALVVLARKLLRVAFALFKKGVRFDPAVAMAG